MAFLPDLDRRDQIPELMDQPGIDPGEHRRALAGLARINRLSRSADMLWPAIRKLANRVYPLNLRLLDLATGSGDVPIRLAQLASNRGVTNLDFSGCDISPTAVTVARDNAARAEVTVDFACQNVLEDDDIPQFDIVTCSLFLHHLSETEGVRLLSRMKRLATRMVLVNDLERSRLGYCAAWLGCHALTRSAIVRFDGPSSVRSALSLSEVRHLADRAGLFGAKIGRRWPFRFLLRWQPTPLGSNGVMP